MILFFFRSNQRHLKELTKHVKVPLKNARVRQMVVKKKNEQKNYTSHHGAQVFKLSLLKTDYFYLYTTEYYLDNFFGIKSIVVSFLHHLSWKY